MTTLVPHPWNRNALQKGNNKELSEDVFSSSSVCSFEWDFSSLSRMHVCTFSALDRAQFCCSNDVSDEQRLQQHLQKCSIITSSGEDLTRQCLDPDPTDTIKKGPGNVFSNKCGCIVGDYLHGDDKTFFRRHSKPTMALDKEEDCNAWRVTLKAKSPGMSTNLSSTETCAGLGRLLCGARAGTVACAGGGAPEGGGEEVGEGGDEKKGPAGGLGPLAGGGTDGDARAGVLAVAGEPTEGLAPLETLLT
eukprot:Gb_21267 [translate_table: standard]